MSSEKVLAEKNQENGCRKTGLDGKFGCLILSGSKKSNKTGIFSLFIILWNQTVRKGKRRLKRMRKNGTVTSERKY